MPRHPGRRGGRALWCCGQQGAAELSPQFCGENPRGVPRLPLLLCPQHRGWPDPHPAAQPWGCAKPSPRSWEAAHLVGVDTPFLDNVELLHGDATDNFLSSDGGAGVGLVQPGAWNRHSPARRRLSRAAARAQARLLTRNQQCLRSGALRLGPGGSGHREERKGPMGLHRGSTKPTHDRLLFGAEPTLPGKLPPCLLRHSAGTGPHSGPGQLPRASSANGLQPASHGCPPVNRLTGSTPRHLAQAAGTLLLRVLPEGSHAAPGRGGS